MMNHYLPIKTSKELTHATTWMSLETWEVTEASQKATYCMIPFIRKV